MESVFTELRKLDAYPEINEDFYSRTFSGGFLTVVLSVVMLLIFVSELSLYLHTVTKTQLIVDTTRGEMLKVYFDVTFADIPCSLLIVNSMDISGERHLDIRHDIVKKRIDALGNVTESKPDVTGQPKIETPLQKHGGRLEHNETYCGSCFGAEASDDHCCNSCEEVHDAYLKKGWAMRNPDSIDLCRREEEGEGCNIQGILEINKVAGNFHFSPKKKFNSSNFHLFDFLEFQHDNYNMTHKINKLAFGDHFPGVVNPLDGVSWVHEIPNGMYQYFIKVFTIR
uniref:Endoplasmic reticulum-Golgi intermediate compartment protein 3 n=1 Tax=Kalanchoe fedtschenkoi TaxID=63787 RepID=A0A7N0T4K7_KALFE